MVGGIRFREITEANLILAGVTEGQSSVLIQADTDAGDELAQLYSVLQLGGVPCPFLPASSSLGASLQIVNRQLCIPVQNYAILLSFTCARGRLWRRQIKAALEPILS